MPDTRYEALTQKFTYTGAGLLEYHGWARPGSGTAASVWKICKHTYDGSSRMTDTQWADGSREFNKAWTGRATFTYN